MMSKFLKSVEMLHCNVSTVLMLMMLCCFQPVFATPTTPTSDFIDNGDGTVTHKLTGLVWMRCSMGQSWDKATSSCTGTAAKYTWDEAMALKSNFAGKSDWRLPNIVELQTTVERENYDPAINTAMFPNTPNNEFWSSSLQVSGTAFAWYVRFGDGIVSFTNRDLYHSFAVRLVRTNQSLDISTPNSDFADNQDGTVTHKLTGLIWQHCSIGQTWDKATSTCTGSAATYIYNAALALKSSFAGHSDWRVPTANELASIVKYDAENTAINTTIFPNTPTGGSTSAFWSSSPYVGNTNDAWLVNFDYALVSRGSRSSSLAVRLVRGQWNNSSASLPDLNMTKANCRYIAPLYNKMKRTMQTKEAPTCNAALRYHTWLYFTRLENNTVTNYYLKKLDALDTNSQLFNARLQAIDQSISVVSTLIDPDLKRALTSTDYQLTVNIMKSKGIVKSLAAGQTPFKLSTVYGRVIDKTFKEKVIADGGSNVLCNMFLTGVAAQACSNEAAKTTACALSLSTQGWKGAAGCVVAEIPSAIGILVNSIDIFKFTKITKNLNGYLLINDYLDNYFKKGITQFPSDDVQLENDVQTVAQKLNVNNSDYDMQFVKKGVRDGIARNAVTSSKNIKLVESLKAILNK
jgi:hypothetical protein